MNRLTRIASGVPALAGMTLLASPAFAAGNTPDLSGLTTAVTDGLGAGIGLMLTFAPSMIMIALTWNLIQKAKQTTKPA